MARILIALEVDRTARVGAAHLLANTLETIRKCLHDGVTTGVLEATYNSRVHGTWTMEPEEETEK